MAMHGMSPDGDGSFDARDGLARPNEIDRRDGQRLDGHKDSDAARGGAEPHGRAALLLVESLIHELVERSLLPLESALGVIDSAASVQLELVDPQAPADDPMRKALTLINSIAVSLRVDLGE